MMYPQNNEVPPYSSMPAHYPQAPPYSEAPPYPQAPSYPQPSPYVSTTVHSLPGYTYTPLSSLQPNPPPQVINYPYPVDNGRRYQASTTSQMVVAIIFLLAFCIFAWIGYSMFENQDLQWKTAKENHEAQWKSAKGSFDSYTKW